MNLPKRVQAELQAAEALEAQLQGPGPANPQVVANAAELVPPPITNEPTSVQQQQPAPALEPAAEPKEDFEHKYRVLQGMYSADVTAIKKQLAAITNQFQGVVRELNALKATREAPAQAPAVDPKDVENFGADIMEMVQRYIQRRVADLEGRMAAFEQTVNGVTRQTALTREQQFYATLDSLVPDWREVNVNERWLAWLAEVDPVYGAPRQAALDAAYSQMNAPQVANVFKAYKATIPPTPAPSSLANQVAPSSAASAVPVASPAKPFVSEKAINDFYRDLGRGAYAGRDAEAKAIEAEINSAVAEGRVR